MVRGSVRGISTTACLATFFPQLSSVPRLEQVGRFLSRRVATTKYFHFSAAGVAEAVDAHRVLFLVNLLQQSRFQHHALFAIKKTFKDAELHPCSKAQ